MLAAGSVIGALVGISVGHQQAAVAADLASRHRKGHRQLVRFTSGTIQATTGDDAIETQIDGDPKGAQHGLTTRVLPKALVVRVR